MLSKCDLLAEEKPEASFWATINTGQKLVNLLVLIETIMNKHNKAKQAMIFYVDQDLG